MPIYEYECEDGHRQEQFTKVENYLKDTICERCGKRSRRILSVPYANNTTRSGDGFKNLQVPLGRTDFKNVKEVDKFMKEKGIVQI